MALHLGLNSFLAKVTGTCLIWLLAACEPAASIPFSRTPSEIGDQTATIIGQPEFTAVASVEPLAARVNGEPISVQEYERAVLRYEAAMNSLGIDPVTQGDYRLAVLDQAIDKHLIVQAARARGLQLDQNELQYAVDDSVHARGGQAGLDEWLEANYYSESEFRQELQGQLLAGKLQAEVLRTVHSTAEHVRARHVLVATREQADALQVQLASGADFATLAFVHSLDRSTSVNGGDLGWFPRGVLTIPEIEAAAFELDPGGRSDILETPLGFHIVESLERDAHRQLSPEAALAVRRVAVDSWLAGLRLEADIDRFVPSRAE